MWEEKEEIFIEEWVDIECEWAQFLCNNTNNGKVIVTLAEHGALHRSSVIAPPKIKESNKCAEALVLPCQLENHKGPRNTKRSSNRGM